MKQKTGGSTVPPQPTGSGRRIAAKKGTKRRKIAFGWYGGKYTHLDFILPHLPTDCKHFCDVFGGSAAILINRAPVPLETYNDIDSDLVNFFRVLRDSPVELTRAVTLTPFSREELVLACKPSKGLSYIERARRFYIRARQTRTGLAQTSSEGRWAHCVLTSRAGMAGAVSRWLGSAEGLPEIAQRLLRVQIENSPAVEVILRYDTEDTLFYVDPPYVHDTRGDTSAYAFEMDDCEHEELAEVLNSARSHIVLSGYRNKLYDRLYSRWRRVDAPEKTCHSVRSKRQESLWINR